MLRSFKIIGAAFFALFVAVGAVIAAAPDDQTPLATPVTILKASEIHDPADPAVSTLLYGSAVVYAGPYVFASGSHSDRIATFDRNTTTGAITYKGSVANPIGKPMWVELLARELPNGDLRGYLYYQGGSTLYWFNIDKSTGLWKLQGHLDAGQNGTVFFSPDKKRIYVNALKGRVFNLDDDGKPTEGPALKLVGSRSWLVTALFSPDGKFLYVVNGKTIEAYAVDPATGDITKKSELDAGDAIASVYSMGITPDGAMIYATCFAGKTKAEEQLLILDRNAASGALTIKSAGDEGDVKGASIFLFNPDGKSGYFACVEGPGGAMGWFTRDPASGALSVKGRGTVKSACAAASLDSIHGCLYAVTKNPRNPAGNTICSFKTPAFGK